jgi:hypothetical protein
MLRPELITMVAYRFSTDFRKTMPLCFNAFFGFYRFSPAIVKKYIATIVTPPIFAA